MKLNFLRRQHLPPKTQHEQYIQMHNKIHIKFMRQRFKFQVTNLVLKKKFMGRINRFKIQCIFLSQEISDQAKMLFYCLLEKEFFSKHYQKNRCYLKTIIIKCFNHNLDYTYICISLFLEEIRNSEN